MTPPWLRLLDPSYQYTLALNDARIIDDAQIGAQTRRRRRLGDPAPTIVVSPRVDTPVESNPVAANNQNNNNPPSNLVNSNSVNNSPFQFHLNLETNPASTLVTDPVHTNFTAIGAASYRVNTGFMPYVGIGAGDFYTQQSGNPVALSGARVLGEVGFVLNDYGLNWTGSGDSAGWRVDGFGGARITGLGINAYMFTDRNVGALTQLAIVNRSPIFQVTAPVGDYSLQMGLVAFNPHASFVLGDPSISPCSSSDTCHASNLVPSYNSFPIGVMLIPGLQISLMPNAAVPANYNPHMQSGEVFARSLDFTNRQLESLVTNQASAQLNNRAFLLSSGPLGRDGTSGLLSTVTKGQLASFMNFSIVQGRYAADLALSIRRTEGWERGVLIGSQLAVLGGLAIGCGASASWPTVESARRGDAGAQSDFMGRAACLQLPTTILANGLGILDGYDWTGDPHQSSTLFWATHGSAAVIGLASMIAYIAVESGRNVQVRPLSVSDINSGTQSEDNLYRWLAMGSSLLPWAAFSWMNRQSPVRVSVQPSQQGSGASASIGGNFRGL